MTGGRTQWSRRAWLGAGAAWASAPWWADTGHAADAPRLVTLGSGVTESAYLLGLGGALVGTDTTSEYPAAARQTRKVGYFRQLSAEGLLALRPTVVVATSEAGPPLVFEQLRSAGVRVDTVPADHSWNEVRAKMAAVGAAGGRQAAAREAQARLDADWQQVRAEVDRQTGRRPRALFLLAFGATPSVAGDGTAADAMLRFIGCDNALRGHRGYRPLTAEGMAQAAPDVLVTTAQGIAALGGPERFWQRPGLALTPAYARRRVLARDALEMIGFGPRLPGTVRALHRELQAA